MRTVHKGKQTIVTQTIVTQTQFVTSTVSKDLANCHNVVSKEKRLTQIKSNLN